MSSGATSTRPRRAPRTALAASLAFLFLTSTAGAQETAAPQDGVPLEAAHALASHFAPAAAGDSGAPSATTTLALRRLADLSGYLAVHESAETALGRPGTGRMRELASFTPFQPGAFVVRERTPRTEAARRAVRIRYELEAIGTSTVTLRVLRGSRGSAEARPPVHMVFESPAARTLPPTATLALADGRRVEVLVGRTSRGGVVVETVAEARAPHIVLWRAEREASGSLRSTLAVTGHDVLACDGASIPALRQELRSGDGVLRERRLVCPTTGVLLDHEVYADGRTIARHRLTHTAATATVPPREVQCLVFESAHRSDRAASDGTPDELWVSPEVPGFLVRQRRGDAHEEAVGFGTGR